MDIAVSTLAEHSSVSIGPLVSVIIPTWNRSKSIARAVQSVLDQTHSAVEVIVCDDGSEDDTAFVIESLALTDPRVFFCPGAHSSRPAVPRNRGLMRARGEWIAFLDSDDCWLPAKLASQLSRARQLGRYAIASDAWREIPGRTQPTGRLLMAGYGDQGVASLLRRNSIITSSALIHRDVMRGAGLFPEAIHLRALEDYAYWLRVGTLVQWHVMDEPLIRYSDAPSASIRQLGSRRETERLIHTFSDYLLWCLHVGSTVRYRILLRMLIRLTCELAKDCIRALMSVSEHPNAVTTEQLKSGHGS